MKSFLLVIAALFVACVSTKPKDEAPPTAATVAETPKNELEIPNPRPWADIKPIEYPSASRCLGNPTDEKPQSSVEGDFDGDGKLDAAIIVDGPKKKQRLDAWVSSRGWKNPITLDTMTGEALNNARLAIAPKEEIFETTCDKTYDRLCDERAIKIVIKTDSVFLFRCPRSVDVFMWNAFLRNFDRVDRRKN